MQAATVRSTMVSGSCGSVEVLPAPAPLPLPRFPGPYPPHPGRTGDSSAHLSLLRAGGGLGRSSEPRGGPGPARRAARRPTAPRAAPPWPPRPSELGDLRGRPTTPHPARPAPPRPATRASPRDETHRKTKAGSRNSKSTIPKEVVAHAAKEGPKAKAAAPPNGGRFKTLPEHLARKTEAPRGPRRASMPTKSSSSKLASRKAETES
ncbi:unnamed protein product [Nyctereutes procyonoides]|uniref:(raccoon dog) hypothetical protein n=1 Tax=Nyctereutes procyonoides TaxID=34880 RepID=A0A811ZL62_NYCPR|nr:unnamed protein product [Nyctereutes procyonoides]